MGDWNEARSHTPPVGGFDTPSEPSPRDATGPTYFTQHSHVMQNGGGVPREQWDWNTDVPDFVPGGMSMKAIEPAMGNASVPVVSPESYQVARTLTDSAS